MCVCVCVCHGIDLPCRLKSQPGNDPITESGLPLSAVGVMRLR